MPKAERKYWHRINRRNKRLEKEWRGKAVRRLRRDKPKLEEAR